MKKLNDKLVCIICTIAMCITCTFSYSWKIAHKTYADTVPTTKQELGMWLSSILASVGARVYITTAQGYEWLADNFDAVMDSIGSAIYLVDLVQDAQNRYDQANSKVVLGEESSKALTGFLQSLVNEGFSENSTDFDIGEYDEIVLGTYLEMEPNTTYTYYVKDGTPRYIQVNVEARGGWLKNNGTNGFNVYGETTSIRTRIKTGDGNWSAWNGYYGTSTYNGKTVYCGFYTFGVSGLSSTGDFPMTTDTSLSNLEINDHNTKYWCKYLYGDVSVGSGTQEVQVYGDGTLGLDDMIDTYDRAKEAEIDYSDFLGEDAGAKTLAEIMALIQEAINSGNTELVDAIPQAEVIIKTPIILPENVDIPLLFQGLPEVVEPECVTLGGCLVSGVQTVSQHLQNVYSSHSAISNFTAVSLALGVAIYIITGGL